MVVTFRGVQEGGASAGMSEGFLFLLSARSAVGLISLLFISHGEQGRPNAVTTLPLCGLNALAEILSARRGRSSKPAVT